MNFECRCQFDQLFSLLFIKLFGIKLDKTIIDFGNNFKHDSIQKSLSQILMIDKKDPKVN